MLKPKDEEVRDVFTKDIRRADPAALPVGQSKGYADDTACQWALECGSGFTEGAGALPGGGKANVMSAARSLMLGCALQGNEEIHLDSGRVYAFGPYFPKWCAKHSDSSWTQMVLKVKHGDRWITKVVGQVIAAHLVSWLARHREYLMAAVPPRNSGANHAASRLVNAICPHMVDYSVLPLEALCVGRRMHSQHHCRDIQHRDANVRGCYQLRKDIAVSGRSVILVDDVVTSGATMQECAFVLRQGGAASVIAIAMARTVRRGRL